MANSLGFYHPGPKEVSHPADVIVMLAITELSAGSVLFSSSSRITVRSVRDGIVYAVGGLSYDFSVLPSSGWTRTPVATAPLSGMELDLATRMARPRGY